MNSLLALLQDFKAANVFNPWAEEDPLDALSGGANGRCERLRAHFDCKPVLMLIGEAPGYQGCHFSGVPFTNEKLILEGAVPRVSSVFRITSRHIPWCEPSATIVWRTLREFAVAERTVLWNTFAWHPYQPGKCLSNRKPTRAEIDAGASVLKAVIEHFSGVRLVPVGRVAETTLERLHIPFQRAVKHPAYGGAPEFRNGLKTIIERDLVQCA